MIPLGYVKITTAPVLYFTQYSQKKKKKTSTARAISAFIPHLCSVSIQF